MESSEFTIARRRKKTKPEQSDTNHTGQSETIQKHAPSFSSTSGCGNKASNTKHNITGKDTRKRIKDKKLDSNKKKKAARKGIQKTVKLERAFQKVTLEECLFTQKNSLTLKTDTRQFTIKQRNNNKSTDNVNNHNHDILALQQYFFEQKNVMPEMRKLPLKVHKESSNETEDEDEDEDSCEDPDSSDIELQDIEIIVDYPERHLDVASTIPEKVIIKKKCEKYSVKPNHSKKENLKSPERKFKRQDRIAFENYLSVADVHKGLEEKSLIKGSLRINSKNCRFAYVTNPDSKSQDIQIDSIKDRNRALENDIVAVKILDDDPDSPSVRMKGKVVYILEKVHPRTSIGKLTMSAKENKAVFTPRDRRVPLMHIPLIDCPPLFRKEHKKYSDTLFLAQIVNWYLTPYSLGTLLQTVGPSGELKTQMAAILLDNSLDVKPFGSDIKEYLPEPDFVIPPAEVALREDFRGTCVFTIDPATARDLDDAMSCKLLNNGNYEIGVHISDVTYYLKYNTILDEKVSKKATTIYLVDGTFHMLPRELCLHCSLLPGCDKLTFSVIWEITKDGKILNNRFVRSIINSCCQLSYEHAQTMLENPGKKPPPEDFPEILNSWNLDDISEIVNRLHNLSLILRMQRFQSGALRIDQAKLSFILDPTTGFPISYSVEMHNESHSLIEEFMLLANGAVAHRIFEDYPDLAFLRCHPPPKNSIQSAVEYFQALGISLDISSAGNLQASLASYSSDPETGKAVALVLQTRLIKTMSRAQYFCAKGCDDEETRHYSLNIPLYTHFTSPIRRYADIMVHRLLAASLNYSSKPKWNPELVQNVANTCNKQKYNAKRAGEMSSDLYLMKFISLNSPLRESAAVLDINDNAMDVVLFSTGLVRCIYFDNFSDSKMNIAVVKSKVEGEVNTITVSWEADEMSGPVTQSLQVFSVVDVELKKSDELFKIIVRIVKPVA